MNARVPGDPDDLARAMLLRIVPTGYRVIDEGDSRFAGVRSHFIRLAFKHVGPTPSLVGFCAPGADVTQAALAAAAWAASNVRPTAVQPRVRPGVLVVAITGSEAESRAGMVDGAAVPAAVWLAGPWGARTRGRPPGAPSPRALKDVQRRLARGEPAPTIGHVDVAERTMMAGGRRQRTFALSSGGVLLLVVLAYLALRFAGPLAAGAGRQAGPGPCAAPGCLVISAGQLGASTVSIPVAVGQDLRVFFPGLGDCPRSLDPSVATLDSCTTGGGAQPGAVATYHGQRPGQARLDLGDVAPSARVFLAVR